MNLLNAYVIACYTSRHFQKTHPEGSYTPDGRWLPSHREDADGSGSFTHPPTARRPFTYLERCRTRKHCKVLVDRALRGISVPQDVYEIVRRLRNMYERRESGELALQELPKRKTYISG